MFSGLTEMAETSDGIEVAELFERDHGPIRNSYR